MMVFADTSALFALLVHDDDMHGRAKKPISNILWQTILSF